MIAVPLYFIIGFVVAVLGALFTDYLLAVRSRHDIDTFLFLWTLLFWPIAVLFVGAKTIGSGLSGLRGSMHR